MNEMILFLVVFTEGFFLGTLFFGGLWWTVQKGLTSNHPALCFFGSTVLRTAVALAGFYFVGGGDWRRLLICLLGFFVARIAVTRITRPIKEELRAS